MKKQIISVSYDTKTGAADVCVVGNTIETIVAWLALSDAVADSCEKADVLVGETRETMLKMLTENFEENKSKKIFKHEAAEEYCDGACGACGTQKECEAFELLKKQGVKANVAFVLASLIGGMREGK